MSSNKESHWIPLADLMTVLMIMFLFVSISFMFNLKKQSDKNKSVINEFQKSKKELLKELDIEFNEDFKSTKWNAVIDSNNLSIRFVNEAVMFDNNKSELKEEFRNILNDFFPRYLKIILQKKYVDKIAEVRIEGHTSEIGGYDLNLKLSQERTIEVVTYLRNLIAYKSLNEEQTERMLYWLTANGLSSGRTIDKNGEYTYISKLKPDEVKCRRVEFRIVTASDKIINKFSK
jgi:outer membrane protein OmpA-like peptidoglycan-associated protein